ncbi:hypothetical protein BT69DRAFT_1331179 [Atractiella rhizophila]|nr:hypothetical protein BT69DRAFT_1331179 [Atractiella rhizophila]
MATQEKDSALMAIGAQCSHHSCLQIDFLPLPCPNCRAPFCSSHFRPDTHSCSAPPPVPAISESTSSNVVGGGTYKELVPSRDRHEVAQAAREAAKEERNREVAERVHLMREKLGLKDKEKQEKAGKKDSDTVRLIKLRQRAKAASKNEKEKDVKRNEKLFLSVVWIGEITGMGLKESEKKELWFHKNTTVGKALDLMADQFQLSNVNNRVTDPSKVTD